MLCPIGNCLHIFSAIASVPPRFSVQLIWLYKIFGYLCARLSFYFVKFIDHEALYSIAINVQICTQVLNTDQAN